MALPTPAGQADTGPDKWTRSGIAIVSLCFAINMADGIDVTILSFIAQRIQADWQISAATMGTLFSAGLVGMAIGGMLIAPLADRVGRRKVILAALVLMSAGMLASGLVESVPQLLALRVVVGSGIGTALASMAAITSESAPPSQRNLAVGIVQAGYPFAAVFTGFLIAWLLPVYGWKVLLSAAGGITVLIFPLAWSVLVDAAPVAEQAERRQGIGALFSHALRLRTLALWGAVFFGLMVLYFIVSWITKLSIEAGLSETNGIYAGALYNFGAFVGTTAMSVLALRIPLGKLVPTMLVCAAGAMLWFGSVPMSVAATLAVAFLIGVLLQGGYNGVWPLAASVYPSEIRATGVGWAIGIGRSGAVIGPLMGGYLMAAKVPLPFLFASYCLPLLACAGCVIAVSRLQRGENE